MTEFKTEIENVAMKYAYSVTYIGDSRDTGGRAEIKSGVLPEQVLQSMTKDFIQLFNKHIEDIPITEFLISFDKFKTEYSKGGHILYDVYFIDVIQDIINILKIQEVK